MSNEFVAAMIDAMKNEIGEIHTAMPGKIIAYNPATGLANVQPVLKKKFPDGRVMEYPVIVGVPVVFSAASGGVASVTLPVKAGDGVLLVFAERSLDEWLRGGETDDPRRYDLTDAIAIPGCDTKAAPAGSAYPNDVVVAHGSTMLRIGLNGDIHVEGGDLVVGGISFLHHVHPGIEPGGGSTGTPE